MTLAQRLLDTGLIQFGWFWHENEAAPFDLHLEMLVSYPDILEQLAQEALALVGETTVTRLLCPFDSIPFALAYSLKSRIPLIYSGGTTKEPVFDLVGAYDIGHPTLMLTNAVGRRGFPIHLLHGAQRVGLEIHTLLTILEVCTVTPTEGLAVLPLLRLTDIVREQNASGHLSDGHAQAVQDWIKSGVQA